MHDRLFARLESLEAGQRKIFAHLEAAARPLAADTDSVHEPTGNG